MFWQYDHKTRRSDMKKLLKIALSALAGIVIFALVCVVMAGFALLMRSMPDVVVIIVGVLLVGGCVAAASAWVYRVITGGRPT